MRLTRFLRLAVASLLVVGVALSVLSTPGLRHRHEEGELPHTHGQEGHTHVHGKGHSHSHAHHGHSHHHGHEAGSDTTEGTTKPRCIEATTAHIHVSFFGIQFTLPDLFGGEDAPLTSVAGRPGHPSNSGNSEAVDLSPPFVPAQIISIVSDIKCVLPRRMASPMDPALVRWSVPDGLGNLGIERPAPLLPPPRSV